MIKIREFESEELARKILLQDRAFSTMRWLLEVANQEYAGKIKELQKEIDSENFLNRLGKKN